MSLTQWTNIAIIFLATQAFILTFVPLIIFFFLVRGMNVAGGALPGYMKKAQSFSRTVRLRTEETTDQIAKPILKVRNQSARVESTIRSFSSEVGATIYGDETTVQFKQDAQDDRTTTADFETTPQ